jgi:hypothetical protein
MPSIGNIVVKREKLHKLLPPVIKPIVKGPSFPVLIAPEIVSPPQGIILPGGKGAAGRKEVWRGITQTVIVGAGSVTRIKVSGVVGVSYTQLSYTSLSYTLIGVEITKALSDTLTITEPLAVQRVKGRSIFEDSPELTELSFTLDIARTKARALTQTELITDLVQTVVTTGAFKELTETVTVSDSVTARTTKRRALATQTVPISESVVILLAEETESYTGDSFTNASYVVGISARKSLTETVAISDLLEGEVTYLVGVHKTKTLTQSITISEGVVAATTKARLVSESVPVTENVTKLTSVVRTSFSGLRFTNTGYTARVRNVKTINETTEESHTVRIALTKNRAISETVSIIG